MAASHLLMTMRAIYLYALFSCALKGLTEVTLMFLSFGDIILY